MTDDDTWITIVVRAWPDAGGLRIRPLRADNTGARDGVVASVDQAAATLAAWLRPATTRQQRAERRGADAAGDDAPDDE
jgi:hypothetical protein